MSAPLSVAAQKAALESDLRALLDVLDTQVHSAALSLGWLLMERCHDAIKAPSGLARLQLVGARCSMRTALPAEHPAWCTRLIDLSERVEDFCTGRPPR